MNTNESQPGASLQPLVRAHFGGAERREMKTKTKRLAESAAANGSAVECAVAKAMWDTKTQDDDSPRWDDLNPHMDAWLQKEIIAMAKAGIAAYDSLKTLPLIDQLYGEAANDSDTLVQSLYDDGVTTMRDVYIKGFHHALAELRMRMMERQNDPSSPTPSQ